MAKKTTKKTEKDSSEAKPAPAKTEAGKGAKTTKTEKRQDETKTTKPKRSETTEAVTQVTAGAAKPGKTDASPSNLLARAEADMTVLLESLNTQMSAAMQVFTALAAAQRGKHEAVIRTKPLDRATAMFQRLVTDMMDERLGEILPTLVALRMEMAQRGAAIANSSPETQELGEFFTRGTEMLDQVLANVDVQPFEPKAGEAFDPLIHLAVGEVSRDDLANDVVAEVLQQGFRTTRGKVIHASRVKVNRR